MTFIHVKGHSSDGGNDRADELAWWGKEEGPYSRLASDGSGEGEGRHRPEPGFASRRQQRLTAGAEARARAESREMELRMQREGERIAEEFVIFHEHGFLRDLDGAGARVGDSGRQRVGRVEDGATSAAADVDLLALANEVAMAELLALERGSS